MKKKIIGLSILLLVLLLGLSTTSFAFEYVVTIEDCTTLANYYYSSKLPTEIKNRMWSFVNSMYTTYNVDTIIFNIQNDDVVIFKGFNSSQVTGMSNAENKDTWNVSLNGGYYQATQTYHPAGRWNSAYWDGGSISTNTSGTCTFGSGGQYRTTYLLVSNNLGSLYVGPYQNVNILTLSPNEFFTFTYDENLELATFTSSFATSDFEVAIIPYEANIGGEAWLGYIEQAQFIDGIVKEEYSWNKYNNSWEIFSATNINWTSSSDITDLFASPNDIANTYIRYHIYSNNNDMEDLYCRYIVTNSQTIISGDTIDLTATFSDDNYYNNYNNNINNKTNNEQAQDRTDDIINSITDDSNVNELLNNFSSGDLASTLGYSPLDNPCVSFIENILTGFCDVLLSSGDVTLDLDIHGHVTTLYSSDFTTPPGVFKTFLSAILTTGYIFIMYKYFYHLVIKLETADIKKVNTEFSDNDSNLF